jgi:hypothetical protein
LLVWSYVASFQSPPSSPNATQTHQQILYSC